MNTRSPSNANDTGRTEPPLWSIGLAVAVILGAPLVLYSLAPNGPIRQGDTVFSHGQQHVRLSNPFMGARTQPNDTCLLDPNSPLIIIHAPNEHGDSSITAEVQGNPSGGWPFCPVHTEVLLEIRQVFQKPAMLSGVREMLMRWFGRE
jgi:hypothetical protein